MAEYDTSWGCDGPVSMPEPIDGEIVLIDFGSHVMTPYGLRLKMNGAVRSEIVATSVTPIDDGSDA